MCLKMHCLNSTAPIGLTKLLYIYEAISQWSHNMWFDVTTAFLNADMDEETHVILPKSFETSGGKSLTVTSSPLCAYFVTKTVEQSYRSHPLEYGVHKKLYGPVFIFTQMVSY